MSNPIVFTLAVLASVLSALVVQPSPHATPPASAPTGASLSQVDQSTTLSPDALRRHAGWPDIVEAVNMCYEAGAHDVFLFGSSKSDPTNAGDIDLLVTGMTTHGRKQVYDQEDRLSKDTDIVLFNLAPLADLRSFVKRNLPGSYHISRDGAVNVATPWLGQGLPKPSFRDEVTDRLERYADAMGYLKISLAEYNLVKRSDDEMAKGLLMRWGATSVVSGWDAWEKMATRICAVNGVDVPKSKHSQEALVNSFRYESKLRGVLPVKLAAQLTSQRDDKRKRGEDGALHRLRKKRNQFASNQFAEGPARTPCARRTRRDRRKILRQLVEAVEDFELVYGAFSDAKDAGKFDIILDPQQVDR